MAAITYKAVGALLDYPEAELIEALPEIGGVLESEPALSPQTKAGLRCLTKALGSGDVMDRQEDWLGLFDRSRARSLHLYEHVHGESRARGQAMASLKEMYRFHGLELVKHELPDYLPLLCEFLSLVEPKVARSLLADAAHILEAVRRRLAERDSPYAAIFAALLELSAAAVDGAQVEAVLAAEPDQDPADTEALDRDWEEAMVTFGVGDALPACAGGAPHAQATERR
jgi:nitrate reductase delta subunit